MFAELTGSVASEWTCGGGDPRCGSGIWCDTVCETVESTECPGSGDATVSLMWDSLHGK